MLFISSTLAWVIVKLIDWQEAVQWRNDFEKQNNRKRTYRTMTSIKQNILGYIKNDN